MTVSSTVTPDEVAQITWDAVVIGAGPAGCITARELALSGCSVLLLEAKRFPRHKVCGGCVNHHAVALLRQCGLESLFTEAGAVPITEFRIQLPDWNPHYQLPAGWSITRATMDSQLVAKAIESGVHYLDEAIGKLDDDIADDFRSVRIQRGDQTLAVRTRIVICAEGLARSSMRRTPEFDVQVANDAFVGAGVIIPADSVPAALRESAPAGAVTMAVGRGGYVGIAQAERGQYSLGAAIRPSLVKRHRSLGAAAAWLLRDSGLADLPELSDQPWQGTPLLRSRSKSLSGKRVFLVGDSAGYVEPFTGEGMAWAIEGGLALAPIAAAGVQAWTDDLAGRWDQVYRRRIRRSQWICRGFMQALHRPGLGRVVAAVFRRFPRAADHIIAAIHRPARSKDETDQPGRQEKSSPNDDRNCRLGVRIAHRPSHTD